jgi:hypothetical protein
VIAADGLRDAQAGDGVDNGSRPRACGHSPSVRRRGTYVFGGLIEHRRPEASAEFARVRQEREANGATDHGDDERGLARAHDRGVDEA